MFNHNSQPNAPAKVETSADQEQAFLLRRWLEMAPQADNPDPIHLATCDKIRDTAHKHGIKAVMHCAGAPFASEAVKRGFDMVMLASDLNCLIAGVRKQLDDLKANTEG